MKSYRMLFNLCSVHFSFVGKNIYIVKLLLTIFKFSAHKKDNILDSLDILVSFSA